VAGLYLSSMSAWALRVEGGRSTMPFDQFYEDLIDMLTAVFLTNNGIANDASECGASGRGEA
jgi:hypothetical protein